MKNPLTLRPHWPAGGAAPILLALLLTLLPGCIASVGGGQRATKGKGHPSRRGIEEYFVGPGILQYFLLPQRLKGPDRRYADLDLVVRDSVGRPLWGLLHVSFVGPVTLTPADTVLLSTAGTPLALAPGKVMFAEPADKQQLTRVEWRLTPAQVTAYLRAPSPALLVRPVAGPGRIRYVPVRKAAARLQVFRSLTVDGSY